jgi:hypothetical protein
MSSHGGIVTVGEEAMTTISTARSIPEALAEVEQWRADEERRHQTELADVDLEIRNLEAALLKVQNQLEAVRKYRADLAARSEALGVGQVGKAYQLLFDVLNQQAQALDERGDQVNQLEAERRAALPSLLADSEVGSLLTEYQQFKDQTEPALARLPESYRSVLLRHHQGVVNRLRDHLARVLGAPVTIEADEIVADVIYAVDAPEGAPELLVIVLPVHEGVYASWQELGDSLPLCLAARVVQAVYEAAAAVGFARTQVLAGGHQGLLVIEVDLTGADPQIAGQVSSQLGAVLGEAAELGGARVRVVPHEVKIDFVLPPEQAEEEEAMHA